MFDCIGQVSLIVQPGLKFFEDVLEAREVCCAVDADCVLDNLMVLVRRHCPRNISDCALARNNALVLNKCSHREFMVDI